MSLKCSRSAREPEQKLAEVLEEEDFTCVNKPRFRVFFLNDQSKVAPTSTTLSPWTFLGVSNGSVTLD